MVLADRQPVRDSLDEFQHPPNGFRPPSEPCAWHSPEARQQITDSREQTPFLESSRYSRSRRRSREVNEPARAGRGRGTIRSNELRQALLTPPRAGDLQGAIIHISDHKSCSPGHPDSFPTNT